ncbi:MbcA/ParS/Xre antitoxin family protein [Arthrobacter castelli]|uniref:MbcA/ParS/Xre antitoxin family protein n=1 Tax=Arthrobacter castelli TaxID=271431 RepID=UPI0004264DBB|nr:MbcA/ParS/Xre antitoxin family protein [Arthrobacter castelli]
MSPQDFLAILQEIGGGQSEALSAGEREFILGHTDLTETGLTDEARTASRMKALKGRITADESIEANSLTTAEVAQLLGRLESNVRRSRLSGDLYSPGTGVAESTLRFPRWQFTEEGHVVPGLRRLLPLFPRYFHPQSIERFMTSPNEALGGLSPVEFLTSGGDVDAVEQLVDELGYE